jgi:hypothetical protein
MASLFSLFVAKARVIPEVTMHAVVCDAFRIDPYTAPKPASRSLARSLARPISSAALAYKSTDVHDVIHMVSNKFKKVSK